METSETKKSAVETTVADNAAEAPVTAGAVTAEIDPAGASDGQNRPTTDPIDGTGKNPETDRAAMSADESTEKADGGKAAEKPVQTREENAEFARKRREQERNALIERVRAEAIIEALGGINPLTGAEMKCAEDVAAWRRMIAEQRKDGADTAVPVTPDRLENGNGLSAVSEADLSEFTRTYPALDWDALFANEDFADYADGKIGKKPLTEIYRGWQMRQAKYREEANRAAAHAAANAKASPGALSTPGGERTYFSPEDVKKMSRAEIGRNWSKIQESRKRW